jgi:hypothetical protein
MFYTVYLSRGSPNRCDEGDEEVIFFDAFSYKIRRPGVGH